MTENRAIQVALHPSVSRWEAEVKYAFRTLLRTAGYAYEFRWAEEGQAADIYYGPAADTVTAPLQIFAARRAFADAPHIEPRALYKQGPLEFLDFGEPRHAAEKSETGGLRFHNDIVFSCYWLLTGAREPFYARDRWDNLHLDGSFFLDHQLPAKPLVSLYAAHLREFFTARGRAAVPLPWTRGQGTVAFAFSHDVDYPQMIRWVECARLLRARGAKAWPSISGVLRGTNHFWKFLDWTEFEKRLGARGAFYFMARQGSLPEYALGTPDAFYDIARPEFRELFAQLRDAGAEIGLHASFLAHRSAAQLRAEREKVEAASGAHVEGNRHHYWHLDPAAPHETLRRHEEAGLVYDSSLAFEFYPGFRRGICHPFRVFHPGERRELSVVQVPPAWMDDHFDRRLAENKIADPDTFARQLVELARSTGGAVVVDYHQRGMNADFYPKYGPWLARFIEQNFDSSVTYQTPGEIARHYIAHENSLSAASRDLAPPRAAVEVTSSRPSAVTRNGKPQVSLLESADEMEWDLFAGTHPLGNIYHTLDWKRVTEEAFGHQPFYLLARDAAGRVTGVLPLFQVKGVFGSRLVSVPMRDRGSLIASDAASAAALVARATALTRELGCEYLELRSAEELDPGVAAAHGLQCVRHWVTTRVDLLPGKDALWKSLDKNAVRWAITNVRKKGVRVERDPTAEGIRTFYEMFARTRSAMGIPPFPPALFEAIARRLIANGKANLFLAWKDTEPVGGMINFFSKDTFIPAYAAPQKKWLKLYPSELVIWCAMEWAADNGFHTFDFGADSPRQTGLLRFKRKWGGVQHAMVSYFYLNGAKSLPNFDSSSPLYGLARKTWSLLPGPLSRKLGGWVTRQLS